MKYERMKKSNVRCNAVASTGGYIKKRVEDILRTRKTAYDVADDVKKEFPILLQRFSRLEDADPSITRAFKVWFAGFQIDMKHITSYIDSAVRQLNKGLLTAYGKPLKLAMWSAKQAYEDTEKLTAYRYLPMSDIMNYVFKITTSLKIVVRELEAATSKVSSM